MSHQHQSTVLGGDTKMSSAPVVIKEDTALFGCILGVNPSDLTKTG